MFKDVKEHIDFINHSQEEYTFLLSTFKRGQGTTLHFTIAKQKSPVENSTGQVI